MNLSTMPTCAKSVSVSAYRMVLSGGPGVEAQQHKRRCTSINPAGSSIRERGHFSLDRVAGTALPGIGFNENCLILCLPDSTLDSRGQDDTSRLSEGRF